MVAIDSIRKERITPNDFIVLIEITKGSKMKYELDKETGYILLDRVLYMILEESPTESTSTT